MDSHEARLKADVHLLMRGLFIAKPSQALSKADIFSLYSISSLNVASALPNIRQYELFLADKTTGASKALHWCSWSLFPLSTPFSRIEELEKDRIVQNYKDAHADDAAVTFAIHSYCTGEESMVLLGVHKHLVTHVMKTLCCRKNDVPKLLVDKLAHVTPQIINDGTGAYQYHACIPAYLAAVALAPEKPLKETNHCLVQNAVVVSCKLMKNLGSAQAKEFMAMGYDKLLVCREPGVTFLSAANSASMDKFVDLVRQVLAGTPIPGGYGKKLVASFLGVDVAVLPMEEEYFNWKINIRVADETKLDFDVDHDPHVEYRTL